MGGVLVDLGAALICFVGQCYPALVGEQTPEGVFQLQERRVLDPGYGGDVLEFQDDGTYVWAIHRVYLLNPKERRAQRLKDPDPNHRVITKGCINVDPAVYEKLKSCCSNDQLTIRWNSG